MALLLGSYITALAVSVLCTPLIKKLAIKHNIYAIPNNRTVHEKPIPKLGGISIFISFTIGIIVVILFSGHRVVIHESIAFWVTGLIILLLGIYDDKKGTNCYQKFFIQTLAAIIVIIFGYKINSIINPFGGTISLGVFSIPLTIFWIVGITNALNLIDGLDGLASGISLGVSIIMILTSLWFGNIFSAYFSAILAGALTGFLIYNFNPATIFLGDSGSLLLGFFLACFSINGTFRQASSISLLLPIVILGIPILDTTLAFIRRLNKGVHPFQADKEHIHHKLLTLGLNHRMAALVLISVSYFWGMLALVIAMVNHEYSLLLLVPIILTIKFGLKKLQFPDNYVHHRKI